MLAISFTVGTASSSMIGSGRMQRILDWMTFNERVAAPLVIAASAIVFGGLVLLATAPTGPSTEAPGNIVALGQYQGKWGNSPRAVIALAAGQTVTVTLPRRHICRVTDPVRVRFEPRVWGVAAHTVRKGCAA